MAMLACGLYHFRHVALLPLFRRERDHRIPCLCVAGPCGLWGSVESLGTCFLTRIVGSLDCRLCQSFQALCCRKTSTDRLPGDLVFLRSGDCELHPVKTRRAEFGAPGFTADYASRILEGTGHDGVLNRA